MTGKVLFNVKTGEFLEEESPFRSVTDLKDFNDDEHYEPGTSETEPGQAVNIKELYMRCMRGEILPTVDAGGYAIETDEDGNVKGMTIDEAFGTEDFTQREGFDLADKTAFEEYLKSKAELSTSKRGAEPVDSSSDEAAVGNSETSKEVKE